MPTKLFFELNDDKQRKIISVGISEFAVHGYSNASTNTIVRNCGISKGSLFKYFANKEDLYFYILDIITAELIENIEKEAINLSLELYQRVIDYATLEFSWYIKNPEKSKMIIGAFTESDTEIYQKTAKRYGDKEINIYYKLLQDVDLNNFRWDRKRTIDILKWFLKGFNEDFLRNIQLDSNAFECLRNEYVKSLTEYLEILKNGLLK